MKSSQILTTLLSMSILCGVHSSYGSEAPNRGIMQTITDSTPVQYLQACGSYIWQTPELRWKKLGFAASLLAPYAASCLSEKPYGLLTALASLIPGYAAYQVGKDISVVRDIQLAKAGKKIPDECIKDYMHAFIDIDNRPIEHCHTKESYPGVSKYRCEDFNTSMFLMWRVIKEYGKDENNKNNLKNCAREVLKSLIDAYEYTGNLIEEHNRNVTCKENKDFYEWVEPRIVLLNKMLNEDDFIDYYTTGHSENTFVRMLDQLNKQFNIQVDTTSNLMSRLENGKELDNYEIKDLIWSFFYTKYKINKNLSRIDWKNPKNINKQNRDQLKVLAFYYAKHPEQIKELTLPILYSAKCECRKNPLDICEKHGCKVNEINYFLVYKNEEMKRNKYEDYTYKDLETMKYNYELTNNKQKDDLLIANIQLDALFSPETTTFEDSFNSITWKDRSKLDMLCKIYQDEHLFARPGESIKSAKKS